MATKVVPTSQRMIGHVPFRSVVSADGKGKFVAHVKFNGKEYFGDGDTERTATLSLRRQVDKAVHESSVPSTRVKREE